MEPWHRYERAGTGAPHDQFFFFEPRERRPDCYTADAKGACKLVFSGDALPGSELTGSYPFFEFICDSAIAESSGRNVSGSGDRGLTWGHSGTIQVADRLSQGRPGSGLYTQP